MYVQIYICIGERDLEDVEDDNEEEYGGEEMESESMREVVKGFI